MQLNRVPKWLSGLICPFWISFIKNCCKKICSFKSITGIFRTIAKRYKNLDKINFVRVRLWYKKLLLQKCQLKYHSIIIATIYCAFVVNGADCRLVMVFQPHRWLLSWNWDKIHTLKSYLCSSRIILKGLSSRIICWSKN